MDAEAALRESEELLRTLGNNLPEGQINQSKDGSGATSSKSTRTEETVNYEITKTKTTQIVEAGQLKRVSVAVLVDGNYTTAADGQTELIELHIFLEIQRRTKHRAPPCG